MCRSFCVFAVFYVAFLFMFSFCFLVLFFLVESPSLLFITVLVNCAVVFCILGLLTFFISLSLYHSLFSSCFSFLLCCSVLEFCFVCSICFVIRVSPPYAFVWTIRQEKGGEESVITLRRHACRTRRRQRLADLASRSLSFRIYLS